MQSEQRVAQPPPKPLMLWDGDCHFCRRWIERWQEMTAGAVEYLTFQEASGNYPEISPAEFQKAVHFIEADGKVFRGAEAVFRSLGYSRRGKWLRWCYERLPGFAAVTEIGYAAVARHRRIASALTRLFWGADVRKPAYLAARRGFLKTLGLVYLFAFISVWVQVDGLMGERGILPASTILSSLRDQPGGPALFLRAPTLFWLSSSDGALHAGCLVGVVAAALLTVGVLPAPALIVCFGVYLSLVTAGEFFFSYQWDILLLETGFVALFLAPWQWRLRRGRDGPVPALGFFLAKALLFKLMFMSGVVKLTSGDQTWWELTALDYHYWTQPLPTVFAWFADQNPQWFKKFSVGAAVAVEVMAPFFIWAPRRLRLIAAALLLALQVAIALTGNYCFFNLLTFALCLLLIDDASWAPKRAREPAVARGSRALAVAAVVALGLTLPLNLWHLYSAVWPATDLPRSLIPLARRVSPFRIANGYGLFRVMTTKRPEIIFEGSADAFDWEEYHFRWKPGDLKRPPLWNAPHQPRLDWSMWFAALGSRRDAIVAERFAAALLRNEPAVLRLLERNPFPDKAPQFLRASVYQYRFTSAAERRESGAWWRRQLQAQYLPAISLENLPP